MQSLSKVLPKHFVHSLCTAIICFNSVAFADEMQNSINLNKKDTVHINLYTHVKNTSHKVLRYANKQRVNQVITDAVVWASKQNQSSYQHLSESVYWQAAGLFEVSSSKVNQQYAEVLSALNQFVSNKEIDRVALINFTDFIQDSVFKARIDTPIAYDYHAAGGAKNPKLEGMYELFLPQKPQHVWVVGAIKNSSLLPFQVMGNAKAYLEHIERLQKFGLSEVWVIAPDGKLSKQKIAYWNEQSAYILPGSVIFVPFNTLPEKLNQSCAELLQHRVMSS